MEKILCVYCGDLFDSLEKAIESLHDILPR